MRRLSLWSGLAGIAAVCASPAIAGAPIYQFNFAATSISAPAAFSYRSDVPTPPGAGISNVQTSLGLIFPLVASRDSMGAWSFTWTTSPTFSVTFAAQTDMGFPNVPGVYPGEPALITVNAMFMTMTAAGTVDISIQTAVPAINAGGIVNAASYAAASAVAAGSLVAAFGTYLLNSPQAAPGDPLPTSLLGLSMQFGGVPSAPLLYVSAGQVNLQVPWELSGQSQTTMVANLLGENSPAQPVSVAPFAPGIFSVNAQGTGQGAILDSSYRLVDSSNPATPGSTTVLIYCTGLGAVNNPPPTGSPAPLTSLVHTTTTPTVAIGGVDANVTFSGLAPGYVGLYQVNAEVPGGLAASDAVPVVVSMSGALSNTVTIAVQ